MKQISIIFIAFFSLIACNQVSEPIAITSAKGDIEANWASFISAWESEDAEACADHYTSTGINVPPSAPIKKGKDEITEFYNFLFDMNLSSRYTHKINSLTGEGSNLIEVGQLEVDWVRNDSTEYTYYARTMTHWVQDENGKWKIDKFIFNNPPAQTEESE